MSVPTDWGSVVASLEIRVLSQKEGKSGIVNTLGNRKFKTKSNNAGFLMESMKNITDPENGWYDPVNDSVIVEADIKVDFPRNVKQLSITPRELEKLEMFRNRMKNLRDLGKATDVQFLVGNKKELLSAHKTILLSASDVFEKMFQFDKHQKRDPDESIEVPDVTAESFRMMLDYMYTEDPQGLDWHNLFDVVKAVYCICDYCNYSMRVLKLKSVLKDWAEWTSIPGPIQLVYSLNTFTRVLWLLIWLGAFGILAYEFYLIVVRYMQFDADINDSLLFEAKRFPILTICNNNPLKLNIVLQNANLANISMLMGDFVRVVQNNYGNISHDHFGINLFENAPTRLQKDQFVRKAQLLLAQQLSEKDRRMVSYNFDEMVKSCHFNNVPCGRSDFTDFWTPLYGACFRFNMPNNNKSEFRSFQAGKNAGLRLLLMAKQTDPISGTQLYLPTTKAAGIRLMAHMDTVDPTMDGTGLGIGLGRDVLVAMQNTKTTLLKEPYGQCRDGDESDVLNYSNPNTTVYSMQSCLASCRQNRTIVRCGCADPRYAKPAEAEYCRINKVSVFCLLEIDSAAQDSTKFSPIRDCGCRSACQSQNIQLLNTQSHLAPLSRQNNYLCFERGRPIPNCAQWYQQNAILLSVWFDGLDFIEHDQVEAYTLVRASTDLGGQMGLWLGVSVISIFEVLTLLLMITLYFVQGRKVRLEPSQEELQRDWRYRAVQELKRELDIHDRIERQIREKIAAQRRARAQKRREAEAELGRAEQRAEELENRARELAVQAEQSPGEVKLVAEAANARALVAGTLARIQQLRELIAVLSR